MISLLNEIKLSETGLLPALISDYVNGKKSISQLYKYPFELSSFKKIIADKSNHAIDRKLLVEVLKDQYKDIKTSDAVSKNIESLLSETTFTVTTAHQPCLFLGPLYFIYKIASTINLANQLKQLHPEYNFVPVFWLGSEDHDTEELNHAYVSGKRIEWKEAGSGAIGRLKIDSLKGVVEELKTLTSNESILSIIEQGLSKHQTYGKFTQYLVNAVFSEHGLVVLDQDDARLKKKYAGIIKDEVLNQRAVEVLKPNLDFIETNYKLQAKPREINFFYLGDGYRERLVYDSSTEKFGVHNTNVSFTKNEIVAEIDSHPERFSPNVIFRPLYQEFILPNLAFVGGSGELNYWLELKPLFECHKVNYPMLAHRSSATIVPPAVQKKLEKLGLEIKDFYGDIEQLINRYVKENMSAEVHLNGEKDVLEKLFTTLADKAEKADATLKQSVASEKQKALASLDNIEGKIVKAEKRKQETSVSQIRYVHGMLFPEGTLQERRENFVPYYAPEFINAMVSNLDPFHKSIFTFVSE